MKDPAFLFYYQDFLVGTDEMSLAAVGAYIRCLCYQAHKGNISDTHMLKICNSHEIHNEINRKFKVDVLASKKNDATVFLFNERLRSELFKRKNYSESRSNNRKNKKKQVVNNDKKAESYVKHMEDEDENENEDENKKRSTEEKQIKMPFHSENFLSTWQNWKEYKNKEFKFKYKSPQSEQAALISLSRVSNGIEADAIKIIMRSMENGWKGFFELKTETSNGRSNERKTLEERLRKTDEILNQLYGG